MIHFPGDFVGKKKRGVKRRAVLLGKTEKTIPGKLSLNKRSRILLGSGLVVGLLAWFFLRTPLFEVKQVKIDAEVSDKLRQAITNLRGRNIFLLSNRKISSELKQLLPSIDKIKLIRGLPSLVRVEITERVPALIWENQGKRFLVDAQGVVFRQIDQEAKQIRLVDNSPLSPQIGSEITDADFIKITHEIAGAYEEIFEEKIDHLEINETTFLVTIVPQNAPRIKIDTNRSLLVQLQSAKQVSDNFGDEVKEYLDPRIEGIVYYK